MNFQALGVAPVIVAALNQLNITTPTPVQEQAIPKVLEGKDVLVSAQTGTGKTFAYVLPMVMRLLEDPKAKALIIAPTRELALQIQQNIQALPLRELRLRTVMLIGGQSITPQFRDLRQNPRIIIGTPGRINDHLERESLFLDRVQMLVLDEFDRMLDMGFEMQLDTIREQLPQTRQTLMFSATVPDNVSKLIVKYTQDPVRIAIGEANTATLNVKQEIVKTSIKDKFALLLDQLQSREGTAIIFVKTKMKAEELSEKLQDENHTAAAMHGDLRQQKRERIIQSFRQQKHRIMVATDVAARGIDVPHVQHVINYDLPECPEDYVHRIGRTGRAGAQGSAVSFICPQDNYKWRSIYKLMNMHKNPDYAHLAPEQGRGGDDEQAPRKSGYSDRGFRNSRFARARMGGSKFGEGRSSRDGEFKPRRFENKSENGFESRPRRERTSDDATAGNGFESRPRRERSFDDKPRRFSDRGSFNDRPKADVWKSESFQNDMKSSEGTRSFKGNNRSDKRFERFDRSKNNRSDRSTRFSR
ncbi:DEAD/DEAH box helicase [bacterium]|nr:DEAD/DEAH box helicase [bacterium]NBX77990.1 DEAD/DEAH box helicase [bacterium]